jgi:hypothetical protein
MPPRLRFSAAAALLVLALSASLAGALSAAPEGGDLQIYYGYASKVVDGADPGPR